MKSVAKIAAIAAAAALSFQPCLAAAGESRSEPVAATMAASAGAGVEFDLGRVETARIGSASLSLAASQQTASEGEDQPRRRGPGTSTWLVIGGVALLVVVLAVVASGSPTPGPREGDF